MTEQGTLYFLPWMRRGLGRSLSQVATEGAPPGPTASLRVSVVVGDGSGVGDSAPIAQTILLRGPGDIVGLSANRVVRSDPASGTQDFEPNYFPCVELSPADLPWMFTPASAAADDRLVPWLALVVVRAKDSPIEEKASAPLRVLHVADASAELPKLSEAWAWAHVQTAADLGSKELEEAFSSEPESFLARLICPRRLDENVKYVAALVPTFEDGRRAGLGLAARDPASIDTSDPGWWKAWTDATGAVELPVYYAWTFKTGPRGDFEQLVRRLTPRELSAGMKDFDIGQAGTTRLPPAPPAPKLVSWKGALVSPAAVAIEPDQEHWDAFRKQMRAIVSEGMAKGSEPSAGEAYDPLVHDPVVGPPAYGALPVGEDAVPAPMREGEVLRPRHQPLWLGEVNLEPTHRSAAGLGAEVVRRNQEALMASAWQQASALPEINRLLNQTRLAAEVGAVQKATKIAGLSAARTLQVAAPGKSRLRMSDGKTAAQTLSATSLPKGMASAAFRRIGRPEGPVGRAMRATPSAKNPADATVGKCVKSLDSALRYADFKRPVGLQIADEVSTTGIPGVGGAATARRAAPIRRTARASGALTGVPLAPMPTTFSPGATWTPTTSLVVSAPVATVGQTELDSAASDIKASITPRLTLSRKLAARIQAPLSPFEGGALPAELRATPQFPEPAYELLRAIDPEYLLPGVGEIPDDTVGLTYVNAAFVEAFLLGANHELSREMLWREYPAVLTYTWLRTFWDALPKEGHDPSVPIEDIGQVSGWTTPASAAAQPLGTHATGYAADGTLVLIIKGDLFRKYPDAVVYATKARWNPDARTDADGTAVAKESFREEDVGADGAPTSRKDPVFVGKLDRNTVFLGFELDTKEALGDVDEHGAPIPGGDAGWFFVFEEPPCGPRFGLDVGKPAQAGSSTGAKPKFWSNASWFHQVDEPGALASLSHAEAEGRLAGSAARTYDDPALVAAGKFSARWGKDAAEMARITLQRPVRMLVHASAMLPEEAP